MGNGINSRNARGALFVVYLDATGGYDKLVFDGLNNGLSTPRVINLDANANTIADKLYVGDLLGNMWSVDITDTSNMKATKLFAADAPIVSAPVAKRYQPADLPTCKNCFMVNFATGKPTVSPLLYDFKPGQHTAYGILDKGATATVNVNSLVKQTILGIVNGPNGPNKVVSQEKVEYKTGKLGWYFPLPVGEMVVANPKYRPGGSVVFFSLSPPGLTGTTCTARSGWTYNLVATNGQAQSGSFDTNRDGKINSADMVSLNGKNSYPGGEASEGIMGNVQLTSSANSNVESIVNPNGGTELIGSALNAPRRLNWQELDNGR
jgi:type IV pilus assembly protein PilY1